jgi:hypothetical protein
VYIRVSAPLHLNLVETRETNGFPTQWAVNGRTKRWAVVLIRFRKLTTARSPPGQRIVGAIGGSRTETWLGETAEALTQ